MTTVVKAIATCVDSEGRGGSAVDNKSPCVATQTSTLFCMPAHTAYFTILQLELCLRCGEASLRFGVDEMEPGEACLDNN